MPDPVQYTGIIFVEDMSFVFINEKNPLSPKDYQELYARNV